VERALTLFNKFDKAFTQLERRTGGSPGRIEWLVYHEPTARRVVGTIYYLDRTFEAAQFRTPAMQVPRWFLERYKDYRRRFGPAVDDAYGRLEFRAIDEGEVDGIPAAEIFAPRDPDAREESSYMEGFGAEDVDFVFRWVTNMMDGSRWEEELERGVDAWFHFTDVVGIDLDGIEARWNSLPRTLIPSGGVRGGAAPATADVEALLDQAMRAYVFGLPEAAMAMCRAVCELVLRRLYTNAGGDGAEKKTLGDLIVIAERKFKKLRQLGLRSHRNNANSILHEYRANQRPSAQRNEQVLSFLTTLRTLIEMGPKPSANR